MKREDTDNTADTKSYSGDTSKCRSGVEPCSKAANAGNGFAAVVWADLGLRAWQI